MVRGRGSGGGALLTLASATRRASVTVSVRQMLGLLADSASNSRRPSRSTTLSRSAVTVAVRVPPARNAISPIGWPGPDLGDHLPAAVHRDGEPAGDDHVERVGHLALAHQHFAAAQVEGLQLGGKLGALAGLQIPEDLDARPDRARRLAIACVFPALARPPPGLSSARDAGRTPQWTKRQSSGQNPPTIPL